MALFNKDGTVTASAMKDRGAPLFVDAATAHNERVAKEKAQADALDTDDV